MRCQVTVEENVLCITVLKFNDQSRINQLHFNQIYLPVEETSVIVRGNFPIIVNLDWHSTKRTTWRVYGKLKKTITGILKTQLLVKLNPVNNQLPLGIKIVEKLYQIVLKSGQFHIILINKIFNIWIFESVSLQFMSSLQYLTGVMAYSHFWETDYLVTMKYYSDLEL